MRDSPGSTVHRACSKHPAVAPTHQDDACQVFIVQQFDDVLDVGVKINLRSGQMNPFAVTR